MHHEIPRMQKIREKLETALTPTQLEVIDESIDHLGHEGAHTGMGHFLVRISSPKFESQSLVSCHRMIYQALGDMMQTDIHALKIELL